MIYHCSVFIICFTRFLNHILACSVIYNVCLEIPIGNVSLSVMAVVLFYSRPHSEQGTVLVRGDLVQTSGYLIFQATS